MKGRKIEIIRNLYWSKILICKDITKIVHDVWKFHKRCSMLPPLLAMHALHRRTINWQILWKIPTFCWISAVSQTFLATKSSSVKISDNLQMLGAMATSNAQLIRQYSNQSKQSLKSHVGQHMVLCHRDFLQPISVHCGSWTSTLAWNTLHQSLKLGMENAHFCDVDPNTSLKNIYE